MLVEMAAIGGMFGTEVVVHVAYAGLVGIEAGQEAGAGGTTASGVIKLGEAETVHGQTIDVRSGDLTTVTADVGEAHVVYEDQEDVWFRGGGGDGDK